AAGGLGGTAFNALTTSNLPAGFTASLSYTATDAILNLIATLGQPVGPSSGPGAPSGPGAIACAFSGNQCNVANGLNAFFNNGGALPPAFVTIFRLTGANLGNALSQLSGEAATGAQQVAVQLTNQFLGIMLDPFVDGRSNPLGGSAIGFAPERAELPDDIALAYAKILKAPPKPQSFEQRWSAWGAGYGGGNRTSGDPAVVGSHDLSATTAGGAAGLRYRLPPRPGGGRRARARRAGWWASGARAAAPTGGWRRGSAPARATRSRPGSTARRARVPPISPPRFPTPTTGCRPTASPSPATTSARASTRSRSAGGSKAAIASPPSTAGPRPSRPSRRRASTRRLIVRPTSTPAASPSPTTRATRPIRGANWAGASTGCCCSTPRPRSRSARAWPGRTTGSAIPPSPRSFRRFPARAS